MQLCCINKIIRYICKGLVNNIINKMIEATQKISVLLFLFFIIGCDKSDVDIVPPTMEIERYSPQPIECEICGAPDPSVFRLSNGKELTFEVIFKDDQALSQYKVDIHNNFDCHGHGGGSAPSIPDVNVNNQTIDWTLLDIKDLSGVSSSITSTLTVPDNVTAGNYHFHIQVIDEDGNDNPFTNFNSLKIKNLRDTIPPEISISQPSTSSFSINKGEVIRFKGKVTDNFSLSDGGNGILYLAYTDLSTGNTFATDQAFAFDKTIDKEYEFDFEFTVPQTLVSRTYRFSLGANDGVRNVGSFVFFEVEVL